MSRIVSFITGDTEYTYDYDTHIMVEENTGRPFSGWTPGEVDNNIRKGVWKKVGTKQLNISEILKDNSQF